jgi:hypothetical protein
MGWRFEIRDPISGLRKNPNTDPGVKKARIPDPDPQIWKNISYHFTFYTMSNAFLYDKPVVDLDLDPH